MSKTILSRRARLPIALAALVAAAGALLLAGGSPAQSPPTVLRLVSVDVGPGGGADVPPRGDSVGDIDTFESVVSDASTGKRLGRTESMCTIYSIAKPGGYGPPARNTTFHCSLITYLPAGQITGFVPVFFDGQGKMRIGAAAILGGTGRYAGARGWSKAVPLSDGKTLVVLHLVP